MIRLIGRLKDSIRLFLTGFIMGAADLVPGVSGGTVAFLMGIYEELIQSIKTLSGFVLKSAIRMKFREAWQAIPFSFLLPLGIGLLTALLSLSTVLTHLLETHPEYLWSFFFGLVLASVFVVRKRVVTWDPHDILAAIFSAVVAFVVVGAVPVETPNTLLALFISGAIAICAMILPGISGSFLLVIMGKYEQVLGAVVNRDILTLMVFGSGAVVGLSVFSRVLSWLFRKHHDIVIALLTGFMVGSLRKVWPWKEVIATRINSHGDIVPLVERNIFPDQFNGDVVLSLVLFALGFAVVLMLDRLQVTKEHLTDIHDKQFVKQHDTALKSQRSGKL